MKKTLLVARWEFLTTIRRKMYILSVIGMPLLYMGLAGTAALSGRSAATNASRVPTAVVDEARILNLALAREQASRRDAITDASLPPLASMAPESAPLVAYETLDDALAALRARKVATVYVIAADYLKAGGLTVYSNGGSVLGFAQAADRQRQGQVADALRVGLLQSIMSGDALARAYAPAVQLKRMRLNRQGVAEPADSGVGALAGAFGVFLLLTVSIFFSAGFLGQATIEDRQNKMIEVLFSSIDPGQLVLGKLIGLGGAGLLQVGLYVFLIIVPGATAMAFLQVPLGKLALSLLYFAIGYLMFACLTICTGMIGRTPQESGQLAVIWVMTAAAPMFFVANIGTEPNGAVARGLSFFPLTTPVTMMLRIAISDVSMTEVLVTIVIGAAGVYVTGRAAAKIFRAAGLMYGKRPTLPELVHWLRAA